MQAKGPEQGGSLLPPNGKQPVGEASVEVCHLFESRPEDNKSFSGFGKKGIDEQNFNKLFERKAKIFLDLMRAILISQLKMC